MLKIVNQYNNLNVLQLLKDSGSIMEGHFELSSGYHSKYYLQCAQLLQYPNLTMKVVNAGVEILKNQKIINDLHTIISPAIGGVLFGYILAYKLNTKMIFTERKNKDMELRRDFKINEGEKVIIAEDVITTGGSVEEVIKICEQNKADIKAIISIIDRSAGDLKFDYPYYSLIKLEIANYKPEECPLCKKNVAIVHPGSKK